MEVASNGWVSRLRLNLSNFLGVSLSQDNPSSPIEGSATHVFCLELWRMGPEDDHGWHDLGPLKAHDTPAMLGRPTQKHPY